MLASSAAGSALLAAVSTVFVVAIFEWSLGALLIGGTIGIALFGGLAFLYDVQPTVARLATAGPPAEAVVEEASPGRLRSLRGLIIAGPVLLVLAWAADSWLSGESGAVFLPGQFAGYAAANLLGATIVYRWERQNGDRALIRQSGEGPIYSDPANSPSSCATKRSNADPNSGSR